MLRSPNPTGGSIYKPALQWLPPALNYYIPWFALQPHQKLQRLPFTIVGFAFRAVSVAAFTIGIPASVAALAGAYAGLIDWEAIMLPLTFLSTLWIAAVAFELLSAAVQGRPVSFKMTRGSDFRPNPYHFQT